MIITGFLQDNWMMVRSVVTESEEFLCILMDFPIQIKTITMGLFIVYFKGSESSSSTPAKWFWLESLIRQAGMVGD